MIPYTAERRPDTGVSNGTLGIWLFLASETMLFGALFSAYALLRTSAVEWPVGREVLGTRTVVSSTFALFLTSFLVWQARARIRSRHFLLLMSSAAAVLFLLSKAFEYQSKISQGLLPASSMFLALYFTLTGFHAAHVIAGLVANVWTMRGMSRIDEALTAGRLKALAIYWGFVDVVWVAILVAFYAF